MSTQPAPAPQRSLSFNRQRGWQIVSLLLLATSLHVVPQLLRTWIDPALSMLLLMIVDALAFAALVRSSGSLRVAAGLAAMLGVVYFSRQHGLVALPSVGLNLVLAFMFAATLRRGRTPIIHAIAAHAMAPEPVTPEFEGHLRRVTLAWVAFFLVAAAANGVLAVAAPFAWWSLFANVLYWPLIFAMFVVEYLIRRTWLRNLPDHTPLQMIASALAFPGDALRKTFAER